MGGADSAQGELRAVPPVEKVEAAEAAAACHLRRTVARDLAALGAVAAEQIALVVSDADEEATARRRGRVRTSRGFAGKIA